MKQRSVFKILVSNKTKLEKIKMSTSCGKYLWQRMPIMLKVKEKTLLKKLCSTKYSTFYRIRYKSQILCVNMNCPLGVFVLRHPVSCVDSPLMHISLIINVWNFTHAPILVCQTLGHSDLYFKMMLFWLFSLCVPFAYILSREPSYLVRLCIYTGATDTGKIMLLWSTFLKYFNVHILQLLHSDSHALCALRNILQWLHCAGCIHMSYLFFIDTKSVLAPMDFLF